MVIIYGDGQTWSNGCLIFNITGYWQGIRINSIYSVDEENWLEQKERRLEKNIYTMTIEVSGTTATLYADDVLVASTNIPLQANHSGQIGLVKYWESADVTFSNVQFRKP